MEKIINKIKGMINNKFIPFKEFVRTNNEGYFTISLKNSYIGYLR